MMVSRSLTVMASGNESEEFNGFSPAAVSSHSSNVGFIVLNIHDDMMFFSSHPIHLLLQDVASIMNALNKKKCSAWVQLHLLYLCFFVRLSV